MFEAQRNSVKLAPLCSTRTSRPPSKPFTPGSLQSGTLFDLPSKITRRKELEEKMGEAGFWDNQEKAKSVVGEVKVLKAIIEPIQSILAGIEDANALRELADEAGDQASMEEADRMVTALEAKGEALELQALLDGRNDPLNCFVTIQAGAGGTEAQDWAEMLARMYVYFWEKRGWDVSEVDRQYGEQAGIKSATFRIAGEYAFGYMRAEAGVHLQCSR
jgi:peptide chain release factor 2